MNPLSYYSSEDLLMARGVKKDLSFSNLREWRSSLFRERDCLRVIIWNNKKAIFFIDIKDGKKKFSWAGWKQLHAALNPLDSGQLPQEAKEWFLWNMDCFNA